MARGGCYNERHTAKTVDAERSGRPRTNIVRGALGRYFFRGRRERCRFSASGRCALLWMVSSQETS